MIDKCPVCDSEREISFRATILKKHNINYLFCKNCGLLQTEKPYWLEEAYSSAIANVDTGLISRNIAISKKLACFLFFLFDKKGKYLDVGGGYGMLTRLMRDIGFDYYWSDEYCENLLAKGFESFNTTKPFSAITAFELLEHIYDPVNFLKSSLIEAETLTIIFSTELFEGSPPPPSSWWYYSLSTGQHISFYQRKTLEYLSQKLSLSLHSNNNFHILTNINIDKRWLALLNNHILLKLFYIFVKISMQSKTLSDYNQLHELFAKV